jgi:hypothetical protein
MLDQILDSRTKAHFAVALLLTFTILPAQAKRKDTVLMKNGDRLTGEVKRLENGVLYIDTDYISGSIGVDWLQVEKVDSTGTFQVVLNNGHRVAGTVAKLPAEEAPNSDFSVGMQGHQERSSSSDVISIETQKQNFWRQLKGSIDVGYDFTSGNTQTSLSSDASATYTTTTWSAGASYNAAYSGQSGGSKTKLVELTGTGERFLNRNSFLFGIADFLHSSQQDLQLRTTLGGGYGRYFIRTNHNVLRWLIGPAYTHEDYQSASRKPSQQAVNALLGLLYQLFRFDR